MHEQGADAPELNVYFIPTDIARSAEEIEQTYLDILSGLCHQFGTDMKMTSADAI